MSIATNAALPTNPLESSPSARLLCGISVATSALVALLAIGAFTLSYDALSALAISSGSVAPHRAWLFPLVVDGAIVIFSVSALRANLCGEPSRWFMSLVIVATSASVLCNMAHAAGGVVSSLVAAMPALLLFLALETLMRQVNHTFNPAALAPKRRRRAGSPARTALGLSSAPRKTATALDGQRERARTLLLQGQTKKATAREVGLALSTVRRLASRMEAGPGIYST